MITQEPGTVDRSELEKGLGSDRSTGVTAMLALRQQTMIPHTGSWLLEEPNYVAWTQRKFPILHIVGAPGDGKTFLSASLMSQLTNSYPQDEPRFDGTAVAYHSSSTEIADADDENKILKSLALQIARVDAQFEKYALKVLQHPDAMKDASSTREMLFKSFYCAASNTAKCLFIVFDGVDEAPQLLKFIQGLDFGVEPKRDHAS